MTTSWLLLIFFIALSLVAFLRLGSAIAFATATLALVSGITLKVLGFYSMSVFVVLSVFFAIFSVAGIRKKLITFPLLRLFKKAMPKVSQTEQEALEAGTVWWDGEIFSGKPNWQRLLDYPTAKLSDEELAFMNGPVETLCAMIDDWDTTFVKRDLSPEVWAFIKEKRFLGMIIPRQYGGLEFSHYAHSCVVTKIATRSISVAVTVMVPNSLGPGELLLHYGTQAQRDQYLPTLAVGEDIPCFALTSPEAGSDAAAIPDKGIVCVEKDAYGQEHIGMRVTWNKRYITLAPVATVMGLAFDLHDPDKLLSDVQHPGITCALIPTSTPGVEIGERHFPLDSAFMNGPTRGKDVFIPLQWVIGGQDGVGKGWKMLMESLAAGRCISLPALSCGGATLAAKTTGAYARIRKQFNTSIGNFEGVQEALARIGGHTYQMNAARKMTCAALDNGERPSVISAILKYHLTENLRTTVNDAMDIQGGSGICLGPNNLFARAYQTIPIAITVEGANILTRALIIFGQGAMRCHPYLLAEVHAAQSAEKNSADKFDTAVNAHIGHTLSVAVRGFWHGMTNSLFAGAPKASLARSYYQQVSRYSATYAFLADVSISVLGSRLKRSERLSARLGDALSQLYLCSASLKRFHDEGEPYEDKALLDWSCQHALYQTEQALLDTLKNYPSTYLGQLLKCLYFPFYARRNKPNDHLDAEIAKILLNPSSTRSRLCEGVYTSNLEGRSGQIEAALPLVIEAEDIERKVRKETGKSAMTFENVISLATEMVQKKVITQSQANIVIQAATARNKIIQVDQFPSSTFT
ncbi:MAG: acyl-CoA dehydrogenase [Gammaproteobacteria bacterium]|jgi:acyl-CoA dehydrogenase